MKSISKGKSHGFRVGVHTSIAGGISRSVERAVSLIADTLKTEDDDENNFGP